MARFNRHDFILKALLDAIGKQSDYWVMLNADAYYEKGILTDDDMQTIYEAIEAQYPAEEEAEAEAEATATEE